MAEKKATTKKKAAPKKAKAPDISKQVGTTPWMEALEKRVAALEKKKK
jgi:hypothetical protein